MSAEPRRKVSIVIPAFNEERSVGEIIRRVQAAELGDVEREIVVVDDGSSDGTRDVLRRTGGARSIFHDHNRGKGAALKSGIAASTGDIIAIQDADLEYDPNDLARVIAPLLRSECDLVIGTRVLGRSRPRFVPFGDFPFFTHYVGNLIILWMTNLLYGYRGTDYEGCYKAVTRSLLDELDVQADGFEFDNELVCKVLRTGGAVVEVPINYTPRSCSEGKKITWRHGVRVVWTILKWRFRPFAVKASATQRGEERGWKPSA